MTSSAIVVGGGFRGIVSAYLLAKKGYKVVLLEKAPFLGGVLHSPEWDGLHTDYGCHVFDNSDDELTEIIFDLAGKENFHSVRVQYAAKTEFGISHDISVPDFSNAPEITRQTFLYEIIQATSSASDAFSQQCENLQRLLVERFGTALAKRLADIIVKFTTLPPCELDADALSGSVLSLLQRIRVLPEAESRLLKQIPALDARLAVSSTVNPLEFYPEVKAYPHRNFYPSGSGMKTFCEQATKTLRQIGVQIHTGSTITALTHDQKRWTLMLNGSEEIQADKVLWTTGLETLESLLFGEQLTKLPVHPVPMVIYYFKIHPDQATGISYVHDYTPEGRAFRISAPGVYGKQVDADGLTYICCEVPTAIHSEIWEKREDWIAHIWQQSKDLSIIEAGDFKDVKILATPVSYSVPGAGFRHLQQETLARISAHFPNIHATDQIGFSKIRIQEELKAII